MPKANGLTAKQENFCREWVKDFNSSRAARDAGYKGKANVTGPRLLASVSIKKRIAELRAEIAETAKSKPNRIATPAELLESYSRDIRFDPRNLFDEKKDLMPIPDLPDDVALSLVAFNINEDVVLCSDGNESVLKRKISYKLPDKNKVRDSFARLLGLTNGNSDMITVVLEALKLIQTNVQNNTYNLTISGDLQRAIGNGGK